LPTAMANFRTNKNNILLINTVNPGQPFFGIFNGAGKLLHSGSFIDKQEELVGKLKAYLVEHKIDTSDLKKIFVLKGGGSFTASRAGVVLAKAIGFLENISARAVDLKTGESLEDLIKRALRKKQPPAKPFYDREPNITI